MSLPLPLEGLCVCVTPVTKDFRLLECGVSSVEQGGQ